MISVPQLRNTAERFVSAVLPDSRLAPRTRRWRRRSSTPTSAGAPIGMTRGWSPRRGRRRSAGDRAHRPQPGA